MSRMSNRDLFKRYDGSELVLRLHNKKDLTDTRQRLADFENFLAERKPAPELGKEFLAKYANKAPRTLYRYAGMIKSFLKWYGQPITDLKIKIPRSVHDKVEDEQIEKLLKAMREKPNHFSTIPRDELLVQLDCKSGLRRAELSELEKRDVHSDFVMVREGKGRKDRPVPLPPQIAQKLNEFVKDMSPNEKVFKLTPASISNKIKYFAVKAGLLNFHTHSMRHKFATDLVEKGADVRVAQEMLGHDNLATTQNYVAVTNTRMREAANRLEEPARRRFDPLPGEDQSRLLEKASIKQDSYVETPHVQKIRELSKSLAGSISLPSHWDTNLRRDFPHEFKPGKYYLPVGLVEIDSDKQIAVKYYDIAARVGEPHLSKALLNHLSTSGLSRFEDIVGDNGQLNNLISKAGHYSQELLTLSKLITDEVDRTGVKVNFKDDEEFGLTKWFTFAIWNDAIQKAAGRSWINDSWYIYESIPGSKWQLRCGPDVIGIAEKENILTTFEDLHKTLRAKYARDRLARDIIDKELDLNNLAQEIIKRLHEFGDMNRLPGRCELC
jgi:site-specific recombinase XerD